MVVVKTIELNKKKHALHEESPTLTIVNNFYLKDSKEFKLVLKKIYNTYLVDYLEEGIISDTINTPIISIKDWKEDFIKKDYSKEYTKQIIAKVPLLFDREEYSVEAFINVVNSSYNIINKNDRLVKLVRLLLNYCEDKNLLTEQHLLDIRKKIKNKISGVDNYVPTNEEVKNTLNNLNKNKRLLYLVFLSSGIRKVEGEYLLDNLDKLKVQEFNSFVKISMNYLRKNKNSYFCYLPKKIYNKLQINYNKTTIRALELELQRKKLIPIKYCRKWFYTKCVELGIPESIADYYQGRTANSVGSNHYLSRQLLADKNYGQMVSYLKSFEL